MNKKRQLLVLPLIFCLSSVFAEKVLLADFFVLDEQGKSIDVNEKESEMLSLDILGNIKIWDSQLM